MSKIIQWLRVPTGGVAHALVERLDRSACGRSGSDGWTDEGVSDLPRCRRCLVAVAPPFVAEADLSAEAQAILAKVRKTGSPFTRVEILDVAPGAAWDPRSRWPVTKAKIDPIRELITAGLIELHEEKTAASGNPYKIWRLVGTEPRSLVELLDAFAEQVRTLSGGAESAEAAEQAKTDRDAIRAEIVRRFDRG